MKRNIPIEKKKEERFHKKEDGKQKQWKRDRQGKRRKQKEKGKVGNDLKVQDIYEV